MRTLLRYLALLALILVVLGVVLSVDPQEREAPSSGRVFVKIPEGASGRDIAEILTEKGLVRHPLIFEVALRWYGAGDGLRSGGYTLREGMTLKEMVAALEAGSPLATLRITVPEGLTLKQLARRIDGKGKLSGAELLRLAADPPSSLGELLPWGPVAGLEGYLFPDTYELKATSSTEVLVRKMLDRFGSATGALDWSAAGRRGLTRHEVVVVASLIEREAKLAEERPLISAVIYNRLAKGMPLQIDATVQYALPETKPRLTYEDLKTPSPYNTYLRKGLPPGPIAGPGLASLKAALEPAAVDYLYYVLVDSRGKHAFARTHEEFLAAKRKARQ